MAECEEEQRGLLGAEDEEYPAPDTQGEGETRTPLPAICDPSRLQHRIVVLVFMCFLGFGSYFCYDNPAALQTEFLQDMDLNTADFMQLYAWYSWPNVVLCFLGGFLLDRVFGIRLGTILFSLFVFGGQIIFAIGGLVKQFWLMEAGRFIFGIGGESLAVAQNTYAVNWFKGKELNLVFGLQLSMARLGSTVNMNIMGSVYNKVGESVAAGHTTLGVSLMIAASTCLFSLICALVLGFLDKRAEKILHKEQGKTGEVIKLTDVKDFPLCLWLIFIICVGYYVAIFPFIGLGQVFFIEKFNFSPANARAVNSIVYIISAPASPVLGFMVDKIGRNVIWVMCAVVTTLAAHMMLAFTFWNPWIAMSLLGVSYSLLACALWPMVAFVVPEHQLGTAYGFMQSIQNLGLALIAMAAGAILDNRGYLVLEVFFCACICIALMAVVMLYFVDYLKGGDLNRSAADRARLQKEATSHSEIKRRPSKLTLGESARLTPMTACRLRNRYLSRLGAEIPDHCSTHLSSLAHRSVLK
ncbi:major facilitator superfamily domain-containing protein 1 isoform X2 [Boleophthalmus pectinirostris]|uniref:major facilitator superfamily domain-containing protein 1 isoform X2 n=2 Tax=Boleophthalmus pectinirostris TaxID=150288 RepID=UPI00242C43DA|nr:major facilitator superfamily domain-containing protein 1 isoform X2 [Boleophthalmus pectinirostris]